MSTTKFYTLTLIISVAIALAFNYWLAAGCTAGSGIITTHGKTCAL